MTWRKLVSLLKSDFGNLFPQVWVKILLNFIIIFGLTRKWNTLLNIGTPTCLGNNGHLNQHKVINHNKVGEIFPLDPNNNKTPQNFNNNNFNYLRDITRKTSCSGGHSEGFWCYKIGKKCLKKHLLQPLLMVDDVLMEVITWYVITKKTRCLDVLANIFINAFHSI